MKYWQTLKLAAINYLQGAAVKAALKSLVEKLIRSIFKNATFGGIKGWFVKVLVKEVILNKALLPFVKGAFRESGYIYRIADGHITWEKAERAENENNQDDYDDAIDDIMRL